MSELRSGRRPNGGFVIRRDENRDPGVRPGRPHRRTRWLTEATRFHPRAGLLWLLTAGFDLADLPRDRCLAIGRRVLLRLA